MSGLNESKGNMYDFVTHTWNAIKGECPHKCSYCYMAKWGKQQPVRLDRLELYSDLGAGNFIFVGSSCDDFARRINPDWTRATLEHCKRYDNYYLFQSKNPEGFSRYRGDFPSKTVLCTTIESNRFIPDIMRGCPKPEERAAAMELLKTFKKYVTIEPILDFDMKELVELIRRCSPTQVNIGADSGRNNLPEPKKDKVFELICRLQEFTKVKQKANLGRLIK